MGPTKGTDLHELEGLMATARYSTLMPSMPLSSPCIAQAQSAWGVSVWCCAGIKAVWELAQEVDKLCGAGRIRMLDIGGGLSVDYSSDDAPKVGLMRVAQHAGCSQV